MLYSTWLDKWLENYVTPSSKTRTYASYALIVKNHIVPTLGDMDLTEITPLRLQSFVSDLLKRGNLENGGALSANYVNMIITTLKMSLKTAYFLGLTDENVADKLKRPRGDEKKIDCFTQDEQRTIEEHILGDPHHKMFGVILCLYTGLRIGELLALEWSDIDLSSGLLFVTKSCHYGKDQKGRYGRITESPKTRSSVRTIPIQRRLMPYLKQLKEDSLSNYVVSHRSAPISVRSYQRSFARMLASLGIPHRGFHSLRHTFATRALECGMDVKTLSEILGHKSPTITLSRYVHSLMDHKIEMMNKLGDML